MTGCASDNYKKSADTAATLTQSSGMITKGNTLIDESLADLNDLVSNPYPDLRKQFEKFNKAVNELDASAQGSRQQSRGNEIAQGPITLRNGTKNRP